MTEKQVKKQAAPKPRARKKTPTKVPKKRGRKSTFTQEIAAVICERISNGESLRSICQDDNMPDRTTVNDWLFRDKDFAIQYARARERQADFLFDEILKIADDGSNDTYLDEDGNRRTDHDVIARSRLRVDARRWMAGKLRPKVYGEKFLAEHTGEGGGPVQVTVRDYTGRKKDDAEN